MEILFILLSAPFSFTKNKKEKTFKSREKRRKTKYIQEVRIIRKRKY
jgi:hypothetical protein